MDNFGSTPTKRKRGGEPQGREEEIEII